MNTRFIPDDEIGYYSACDNAITLCLDVYQSDVIQLVYAYGKSEMWTQFKYSWEKIATEITELYMI